LLKVKEVTVSTKVGNSWQMSMSVARQRKRLGIQTAGKSIPVSSPSKSIRNHETLKTMIFAYMMKKFGTLMCHLAHYEFESVF